MSKSIDVIHKWSGYPFLHPWLRAAQTWHCYVYTANARGYTTSILSPCALRLRDFSNFMKINFEIKELLKLAYLLTCNYIV